VREQVTNAHIAVQFRKPAKPHSGLVIDRQDTSFGETENGHCGERLRKRRNLKDGVLADTRRSADLLNARSETLRMVVVHQGTGCDWWRKSAQFLIRGRECR
jgi:hypothetical protein